MPTGPTTENCYPTRRPTAPAPPCWEPTPNSGAPAGALLPGRSSSCPHPAAAPDRHGCRRQRRRRRTCPTLAVGIPASCRQRPAIPGRGEDPQGFTLAKHPRWARADAKGPESNGFRGLLRLLAPVRLVRITRAVHAAVAVEQCCYLNFPRPTTSGSGMATACELAG